MPITPSLMFIPVAFLTGSVGLLSDAIVVFAVATYLRHSYIYIRIAVITVNRTDTVGEVLAVKTVPVIIKAALVHTTGGGIVYQTITVVVFSIATDLWH